MMKKIVKELLGLSFDSPIIYCDYYNQESGRSNLCGSTLEVGSVVIVFNNDL